MHPCMAYDTEVEVVSVTQATDVLTGDLVYQVGLGRTGKPVEGVVDTRMKRISSSTIVIFMPIEGECPYVPGSKWKMSIANDGQLTLERLKTQ